MEQALAAILDEAAARAQEEDRLAEEAAEKDGGPLGFIEEEEDAVEASSEKSKGAVAWRLHARPLCILLRCSGTQLAEIVGQNMPSMCKSAW